MTNFNIIGLEYFTPLVVLTIGLASQYLTPFFKSQDILEKEIKLLLSKLHERVSISYSSLLEKALLNDSLDISNVSSLRGMPPHKPDLIGNHTKTLFRSIENIFYLKNFLNKVRFIYSFIFYSVIIAVIFLIISFCFKQLINNTTIESYKHIIQNIIQGIMFIFLFGQIGGICYIRNIEKKIKSLEEELLDAF